MLSYAVAEFKRPAVMPSADEPSAKKRAEALARFRRLSRLVDGAAGCQARIRTQVTARSGGFVDLEIRLRPDPLRPQHDLVFWVEVKHGAPVHGDQLDVYERDLAEQPAEGCVLIVAPLQAMPDEGTMPVVPWQRLADRVRVWLRRSDRGAAEQFVLREYSAYLKEEALMDDNALTTRHALALAEGRAAMRLIKRLLEEANKYVQEEWADMQRQRERGKYEEGWWASYPLVPRTGGPRPSETWREGYLEWQFSDDGGREDARHTPAFKARRVAHLGAEQSGGHRRQPKLAGRAAALGFESYPNRSERRHRIFRFLYPEQLLAETTLSGQARFLGDWVLDAFRTLVDRPPPQ